MAEKKSAPEIRSLDDALSVLGEMLDQVEALSAWVAAEERALSGPQPVMFVYRALRQHLRVLGFSRDHAEDAFRALKLAPSPRPTEGGGGRGGE